MKLAILTTCAAAPLSGCTALYDRTAGHFEFSIQPDHWPWVAFSAAALLLIFLAWRGAYWKGRCLRWKDQREELCDHINAADDLHDARITDLKDAHGTALLHAKTLTGQKEDEVIWLRERFLHALYGPSPGRIIDPGTGDVQCACGKWCSRDQEKRNPCVETPKPVDMSGQARSAECRKFLVFYVSPISLGKDITYRITAKDLSFVYLRVETIEFDHDTDETDALDQAVPRDGEIVLNAIPHPNNSPES